MTATTSADETTSPKNRPDGATPESETDGLNLLLGQLRDAFTQSTRAESVAQFAAAMVLATAYTAAGTRTTIQGQTENFATKLAAQLACEGFEAACEREYAARAVTIQDLDVGMSEMRVYGPTATGRLRPPHPRSESAPPGEPRGRARN